MEKQDKTIVCKDCGKEFEWKSGEQKFYAEKGLNPPTRCLECRSERRKKFETKDIKMVVEEEKSEIEKIFDKIKKNTIKF